MEYIITFLEGIITFISPCLLPMLPVYISYFTGGNSERKTSKTLSNSIAFVLGFTTVFVLLGALAGTLGSFLVKYQTIVNVVTGLVVVFLGLNFLGVFNLNIFRGINHDLNTKDNSVVTSFVFGVVFSIGWTPCVGAFLGSALMLASSQGQAIKGIILLLLYSLGLGIPFVVSALLIDKLKSTFNFIKRNYRVINIICGIILTVVGILMMSGLLTKFVGMLA